MKPILTIICLIGCAIMMGVSLIKMQETDTGGIAVLPIHDTLSTIVDNHKFDVYIDIETNGCRHLKVIHDDKSCTDWQCEQNRKNEEFAKKVLKY